MAHKDRKIRKLRGSRHCGYGIQQHRGAGCRGGRGMAGSKKHKWSWVSKNIPNYFGSRGFKRPKNVVKRINSINVGYLNENIDKFVKSGIATIKDNKYCIDLSEINYQKLLGSGRVDKSFIIRVEKCSRLASKKIEDSGGEVITLSKSENES